RLGTCPLSRVPLPPDARHRVRGLGAEVLLQAEGVKLGAPAGVGLGLKLVLNALDVLGHGPDGPGRSLAFVVERGPCDIGAGEHRASRWPGGRRLPHASAAGEADRGEAPRHLRETGRLEGSAIEVTDWTARPLAGLAGGTRHDRAAAAAGAEHRAALVL